MNNRKITKALLAFGISALTATSVVSFVACDSGEDGKDGHVHKWSDWTSISATQHERECTEEGHEGNKKETANHGTPDGKNQCPDCHYQFTIDDGVTTAKWTVTSGATDKYSANSVITDNSLFTLKTSGAGYHTGDAEKGNLSSNTAFAALGTTSLTSAIRSTNDVSADEWDDDIYTVTAKKTATVTLYLNFVNNSYNSNRVGAKITVTSDADAYFYKESVGRENSGVVALEFDVVSGKTYKIGVVNTLNQTGRLWLFGATAEVTDLPLTVNYKYGTELISNLKLTDGATLVKPADDPIRKDSKFLGWFTSADDGEEYPFGAIESGKTNVNVYAHFKKSDVLINYYVPDDNDESEWKLVNTEKAYSGDKAAGITVTVASGYIHKGWTTDKAGKNSFNMNTFLTANETINLYAKIEAITGNKETVRAQDLSLVGDKVDKGKTVYDAISFTWNVTADAKSCNVVVPHLDEGHTYTLNDTENTNNVSFNKLLSGTSTGTSFTITAKRDITLVVYYTILDASSCDSTAAKENKTPAETQKSGELQWKVDGGELQSDKNTSKKSSIVAYSVTINLNAGESCELTASSNRLAIWGIVGIY
ncbi:MAG: InlB B-repeat-containing protein [Clostridia bacterium]|nr:InlB B-repeat-containing protein [Clostridia bacterium]